MPRRRIEPDFDDDGEGLDSISEEKAERVIRKFLERKCSLKDSDQEEEIVLKLNFMNAAGSPGKQLGTYVLAFDNEDAMEDAFEEIFDDAAKATITAGMPCKFLLALEKGGRGAGTAFNLKPLDQGDPRDAGYNGHTIGVSPDEEGFKALMVKHTEFSVREMARDKREYVDLLRDDNAILRAENAQFKKDWFEVQKFAIKLQDAAHLRDMDFHKFQKEDERKDKTLKMLAAMAPIIATKLLGGGQAAAMELGNQRTPPEMMLEGLFESMTDEQKQQLVTIFNPIQQQTVFQILQYFEERRAKEAEMEKNQSVPGAPPPSNQGQPGGTHRPFPGIL